MFFSKNINSLTVLESELIRLKALYAKALETKNETTVKNLRKTIKLVKAKIIIIPNNTTGVVQNEMPAESEPR